MIKYVHVLCTQCQRPVEKIEYEEAEHGRRVDSLAALLEVSPERAAQIYADSGRVHPRDEALRIAAVAAAKGLAPGVHDCPSGCNAPLRVTQDPLDGPEAEVRWVLPKPEGQA